VSDSSLPPDEEEVVTAAGPLPDLPDLPTDIGDLEAAFGATEDPVIVLQELVMANGEKMNTLSRSGVELRDAHSLISNMINQAYLEAILRVLAGEGAVVEVGIHVHREIAPVLARAASQVTQARLAAPASAAPPNREQRRHG
jgi:hypothetical protein